MLPRIKWMMQVCTIVAGQTAATESGRPFKPSQTRKNTSATPRLFSSVNTAWQTFAVPTGLSRPAAPCASSRQLMSPGVIPYGRLSCLVLTFC
jgi:hypothetical protein